MENKENVVLVVSTNFYVLKEKPGMISYKEIKGHEKHKWHHVKLNIDLDDTLPNDDEIMFCYGDLWKTIIKKEEFQK